MTDIVFGAMWLGTRIGDADGFALLDRFVERGGRWIDTANNYAFWLDKSEVGGQSEALLGRWLAARPGMRDRVSISTKMGAQPTVPGRGLDAAEGLSGPVINKAAEQSLTRLGVDHIDMYWAHVEDRTVPLDETVGAFGDLVTRGLVRRLGASNHAAWRVERARRLAADAGVAGWTALQLRYSYVRPRPGAAVPDRGHQFVGDETLDFVRSNDVDLWAYTALQSGGYTRADKPFQEAFDHPGTTRRLAVLSSVAGELGVTRSQIVLAWLLGGDPGAWPIVGASTLAGLDEAMDAREIRLDAETRRRLDEPA